MGRVAAGQVTGSRAAGPHSRTRPLDRRSTGERVAEHIRRLIFDGVLRPGDRIPQDAIAAELGVSRLPVREAIQEMARDGLVEIEPHSGAFAAAFDADVVRDHFEVVGAVQGLAAARLAADPDPTVVTRLAELEAAITAEDDPTTVHDLTMEFMRTMNLAGGSVRLHAVLRALGRMLPRGFFAEIPGALDDERRGTRRILQAIQSGSPETARRACVDVQRERAELVVSYLRARGVLA